MGSTLILGDIILGDRSNIGAHLAPEMTSDLSPFGRMSHLVEDRDPEDPMIGDRSNMINSLSQGRIRASNLAFC
jgi:hypothetical protein